MIYDCFIASYEKDALEVRFRELERVTDLVHVAVEASTDFQGEGRRYTMPDPRFDPWRERISWHTHDVPDGLTGFAAEHWLRDLLPVVASSAGAGRDDVIMVSDGDEIPTVEQVLHAAEVLALGRRGGVLLPVDYRELKVDWRAPDSAQPPNQPYATLRRSICSAQYLREEVRYEYAAPGRGWHLSSMGGPEVVRRKLSTFSHADEISPRFMSVEWLEDCARRGRDLLDRFDLEPVPRETPYVPACIFAEPSLSHLLRKLD